ncbi:MAG: tetratricopeptide repeat protein, partial [Deltaproteobacteria bacterium]|nr:tetratricopeptide repeat protein [Deltaproteobacteria bacterium]
MRRIIQRALLMALSGALVAACETTPKPKPTAKQQPAIAIDAKRVGRAIRRVDALVAQARADELKSGECANAPADPVCAFAAVYAEADRNRAWKTFNGQAKRDPADQLAQLGMQLIYIEWKIDDQATQCYQRAIAIDPGLAIAHARMGVVFARQSLDDRARDYFKQALAIDPQDGDALLGLARLDAKAGDSEPALAGFRAASAAWPESAAPALEAAALAEAQDDPNNAELYYREAADRAPRSVETRRTLGALLVRQGKLADARAVYDEAIAIEPDFTTLVALAKLAEQSDEPDAAFEYYRRAGEVKAEDLEVQRALGKGYLERKQLTGAEQAFKQVLKLAPDDVDAHLALARLNAEAQRYSEAVLHFRAALASKPDPAVDAERKKLETELRIPERPVKGGTVNATFDA